MRTLILYSSSALFLLLTAAFGCALWHDVSSKINYSLYYFEGIGVALYVALRILFLFLGRTLEFAETFYHELNHTFFAVLCFHKVESFSAHAQKGGLVTFEGDLNPVIALSPYSFPLFAFTCSLLSLILIPEARLVARVFVGFFLAFHLVVVLRTARPYQTDLQLYGYAFSYSAILFSNIFWIPLTVKLCSGGFSSVQSWCVSGFETIKRWTLLAVN